VSTAQKLAIREYWPTIGIELKYGVQVNLSHSFAKEFSSYVLDIGFGMGDSLVHMARFNPAIGYLGCEIHRSGIGSALLKMHSINENVPDNIRIVRADVAMLVSHLPEKCLSEICIYFPDPWPNAERDAGRRVIRLDMVAAFEKMLIAGGRLHIATDVEQYAEHVVAVMSQCASQWICESAVESDPVEGCPTHRCVTKYELRAKEMGHRVWDFTYVLRRQ
jgi:tRNA (guanine-N7-)-methyltransferase